MHWDDRGSRPTVPPRHRGSRILEHDLQSPFSGPHSVDQNTSTQRLTGWQGEVGKAIWNQLSGTELQPDASIIGGAFASNDALVCATSCTHLEQLQMMLPNRVCGARSFPAR
jgi:hypothetical protein